MSLARKCCACGSGTCETCISGAEIQNDGGCCHTPVNKVMLWIDRPGRVVESGGCCPQVDETFDCFSFCCRTEEFQAPPVRALYDYLGKGPKFRVVPFRDAIGVDRLPFQCSTCDQAAEEPGSSDCCGDPYFPPYEGCECDPEQFGKNLSPYNKRVMEQQPAYWLALDIHCYADGAQIYWNPTNDPLGSYYASNPCSTAPAYPGTLWHHTLAIIHKEHWYRFSNCPDNPWPNLTVPNGTAGFDYDCMLPKHFIYACSGAPLFDFDLDDAVDRNYITAQERCDLLQQLAADWTNTVPDQVILRKLCNGGYFDTRDWRQQVVQELAELHDRFPEVYPAPPACEDLDVLGPIRRRLMRQRQYAGGTAWETVMLAPSFARDQSIQLPAAYDLDPFAGVYPGPGDPGYDDFVFWADRRYVYFHARPGGWDWSCWDAVITGGQIGDDDEWIPHIVRRDSDHCNGDCLNISGGPRNYSVGECETAPVCHDCTATEDRGCGEASCPQINCAPQDYCAGVPENGGRVTPCENVMLAANCYGIHFRFTSVRFEDTGPGSDCDNAGWRNAPKCETLNHAYLFRVEIDSGGDYDASCPWKCRTVDPPTSIVTAVPNVYDSLLEHRSVCAAIDAGCPDATRCCGTFCLPFTETQCCDSHVIAPACTPDPGTLSHPCRP